MTGSARGLAIEQAWPASIGSFLICLGILLFTATAWAEAGASAAASDAATRRLLQAADRGSVSMAKAAIAAGARIDEGAESFTGPDRQPALVAAALRGHARVVRLLLEAGADPSVTEKDGFNVWHAAAFQGRVDVMRVLDEFDVPGYAPAGDGFYPLHRAAWGRSLRHVRAVAYLIGESGRACDARTEDGRTALASAKHPRTKSLLSECMAKARAAGEAGLVGPRDGEPHEASAEHP